MLSCSKPLLLLLGERSLFLRPLPMLHSKFGTVFSPLFKAPITIWRVSLVML